MRTILGIGSFDGDTLNHFCVNLSIKLLNNPEIPYFTNIKPSQMTMPLWNSLRNILPNNISYVMCWINTDTSYMRTPSSANMSLTVLRLSLKGQSPFGINLPKATMSLLKDLWSVNQEFLNVDTVLYVPGFPQVGDSNYLMGNFSIHTFGLTVAPRG